MLTKDASNTLLKTLEEPPAHVVFVLATTEPERVLPTIRSRTQHFEFRYLTVEELSGLLASVLEDERVESEPDALTLIARAAGGSARDAESLLDLVLANGGPITVVAVENALGGAPFELRMVILDAIAASDVVGVLTGVDALLDAAHDPRRIAEGLLVALRDAFITVASGGRVEVDEPAETRERLRTVGEAMGNAALVRSLETLGQAIVDMRTTDAADPRLVLEIALVRLARRETAARSPACPTASTGSRHDSRTGNDPGPGTRRRHRRRSTGRPVPRPPAGRPRCRRPPALGPRPRWAHWQAAHGAGGHRRPRIGRRRRRPRRPAVDPSTTFDLDDVIVAWAAVLDALPRSLRASVQEAQPVAVDGNVVVFGVARTHIDAVRPKFQKNADAIRDVFIAELGSPPRFKFTPHEWGEGEGPPHRLRAVPDPEPPPARTNPSTSWTPRSWWTRRRTQGWR